MYVEKRGSNFAASLLLFLSLSQKGTIDMLSLTPKSKAYRHMILRHIATRQIATVLSDGWIPHRHNIRISLGDGNGGQMLIVLNSHGERVPIVSSCSVNFIWNEKPVYEILTPEELDSEAQ